MPPTVPHHGTVLFHYYPDARHRGRFVNGRVSTFNGFAKYRRWSPLDAVYFFGYALWHYHVMPFTLGDARLVRVLTPRGVPEGIDVVFPRDVQTHCRRQQFYFGGDGRIVRHDYVADIVGVWARGSHFWEDYDRSQGVLIARRRRVVVRLGRRPLPIPVLTVQLGEPSIQF